MFKKGEEHRRMGPFHFAIANRKEAKSVIVRLEQIILENGVQKGQKSITYIPDCFEVPLQFKISGREGEENSEMSTWNNITEEEKYAVFKISGSSYQIWLMMSEVAE